MRLRQLLSIVLMLALFAGIANAATSELKNVSVASQGNSTVVTLIATGAFGHNEYRANQNLLFVDLTGVSVGKFRDAERNLQTPGVQSYRVVAYKGMGGEVARVELRITDDAEVKTTQSATGLTVTITSKASQPSAATGTNNSPDPVAPVSATAKSIPGPVSRIKNVGVVHRRSGIEVEVTGTTPLTAKILKLTSPDRIVLDIPNSQPVAHPATIAVNSGDVKSIRTSRYQQDPPVTRVVVDLSSMHEPELSASGNKLILKILPSSGEQNPGLAVPQPAVVASTQASPYVDGGGVATAQQQEKENKGGSGNTEAKPIVFVEPKYQTRQENGDPSTAADRKLTQSGQVQLAVLQQPVDPAAQSSTQPTSAHPAPMAASIAGGASAPKGSYTGEPISVNLKDVDLKDFFRLIHEISGLNVVLDPGVTGSLTLVLDDVPWDQALDIVLKNNSLDKQLEGNVLRISTVDNLRKEAQAKRLQLEAEALAVPKVSVTRFLSYAHAKDVLPTVKKLLSSRGDMVADDRMNALVIQDIPSVIPDVDQLIAQLDRKTKEVDIEARVVAATRTFTRDIGSMLGLGWGNGVSAVGGVPAVGSSSIGTTGLSPNYFITQSTGATTFQSIPLISSLLPSQPTSGISFMNATNNYRVDAMLAAAEKRGLLKILSRPHVVTQNNVQALVKQGMRIPVTTQQQLGGPPTVQYIDAVLRLTVTPQITAENTIFLNVDIENTQADLSRTVQDNPVFLTQQTTTQVLVTDGGTVMIGGVVQTTNSVNTQQVPFLGNVPVIGNLFKRRIVDNSTQELIFIITPKIVQT